MRRRAAGLHAHRRESLIERGRCPAGVGTPSGTWNDGPNAFDLIYPIDWDADPFGSRSWRYKLNAWRPLDSVLATWDRKRASEGIFAPDLENFALTFALDWADDNFFPGEDYRTSRGGSFIWYDMAAGHRAALLGQLVRIAACSGSASDEQFLTLLRSSADHLAYLGADRYHVGHNNHGIYQSAGALVLCDRVPELRLCPPSTRIAEERLLKAFAASFSEEGVHLEHSPAYHLYMLEVLRPIVEVSGLSEPARRRLESLHAQAQEAQAWFIKPQGKLTQFGDTGEVIVTRQLLRDLIGDQRELHPLLAWTLSAGAEGRPHPEDFRLFSDAGYAVYRQKVGPDGRFETASYLALAAAFHSRIHKHVDELSFEWTDLGHDILVEPGRFGYEGRVDPESELGQLGFYYAHPARIYVESPHAHNTVEIDGSPDSRRAVKPYGSGVRAAGMTSAGWFYADAAVVRKETIEHRRVVVLNPNHWLLVYDQLVPTQEAIEGSGHSFTQWFHLNPAAVLIRENEASAHFAVSGTSVSLSSLGGSADALSLHKGETAPRYQGWHSNRTGELIPNYAVGFSQDGARASFATLIDLSGKEVAASSFQPGPAGPGFRASWTYADGTTVAVSAAEREGKLVIR